MFCVCLGVGEILLAAVLVLVWPIIWMWKRMRR